jgi:hypothetical protein
MVLFEHDSEYLNNMTEQLNEELSRQGYFVTTDLCRKYNFGIAFVQQVWFEHNVWILIVDYFLPPF